VADRGCFCGNIKCKYSFINNIKTREWLTAGGFVVI
jgi:hypothetical protein